MPKTKKKAEPEVEYTRYRKVGSITYTTYEAANRERTELEAMDNGSTTRRQRVRKRADGTFDAVTYERSVETVIEHDEEVSS